MLHGEGTKQHHQSVDTRLSLPMMHIIMVGPHLTLPAKKHFEYVDPRHDVDDGCIWNICGTFDEHMGQAKVKQKKKQLAPPRSIPW